MPYRAPPYANVLGVFGIQEVDRVCDSASALIIRRTGDCIKPRHHLAFGIIKIHGSESHLCNFVADRLHLFKGEIGCVLRKVAHCKHDILNTYHKAAQAVSVASLNFIKLLLLCTRCLLVTPCQEFGIIKLNA